MGTGTNHTHITKKYINKLGELIKICLAQKGTEPSNAIVILFCNLTISISATAIHCHGSEFDTIEFLATTTHPFLLKKDGTL